jgi:hypothetical protein
MLGQPCSSRGGQGRKAEEGPGVNDEAMLCGSASASARSLSLVAPDTTVLYADGTCVTLEEAQVEKASSFVKQNAFICCWTLAFTALLNAA